MGLGDLLGGTRLAGIIMVGTSGFSYSDWRGVFYPPGLPGGKWLEYYASRFRTVELNYTFYKTPSQSSCEKWRQQVPKSFVFAVKGSRFITHVRHLRVRREELERFAEPLLSLREKLGIVLWQLPPRFHFDLAVFESFAELLAKTPPLAHCRHAFEPRDTSWFSPSFFKFLRERDYALVHPDPPVDVAEVPVTASYNYRRMHYGELPNSCYTNRQLRELATESLTELRRGRDVYVYFNNDAFGCAAANAAYTLDVVQAGYTDSTHATA